MRKNKACKSPTLAPGNCGGAWSQPFGFGQVARRCSRRCDNSRTPASGCGDPHAPLPMDFWTGSVLPASASPLRPRAGAGALLGLPLTSPFFLDFPELVLGRGAGGGRGSARGPWTPVQAWPPGDACGWVPETGLGWSRVRLCWVPTVCRCALVDTLTPVLLSSFNRGTL